jgi:sugar lactone lactonase YvrE
MRRCILLLVYLGLLAGCAPAPTPSGASSVASPASSIGPSLLATPTAQLIGPGAEAIGPDGLLYFSNCDKARIVRIEASGSETVIAGTGPGGFNNGFAGEGVPATAARFQCPIGLAFDAAGNLFIADQGNNRVRKIGADGLITTVAGTGQPGYGGDGGPATEARLNKPSWVATDAGGNLYISDRDNDRVRKVDANGIITTIAGSGTNGFAGDGGPATAASFDDPEGLGFNAAGNLYVPDDDNSRVRRIDRDGIISTFAGSGVAGSSGDGGPATAATLNGPNVVVIDSAGNVYFAEVSRIRRVDLNGVITTYAGNGSPGNLGDGGPATAAQFGGEVGLALDDKGNLYIGDGDNGCVRLVNPSGIISSFWCVAP